MVNWNNPEEVREWKKEYRSRPEVKELTRQYNKIYYQNPEVKEKNKLRMREYSKIPEVRKRKLDYQREYQKIPEVIERYKLYKKEYHQKPEVKNKKKKYYQKLENKIHKRKYQKEYAKTPRAMIIINKWKELPKVKERMKEYRREYKKERLLTDKHFAISCRLIVSLRQALKRYSKTGKVRTSKKYGINYKAIIEQLKPFPENIKDYHIDHVIPLSSFDFNDPKQIKEAFKPENHQWLTAEENLRKGNRCEI